MKIFLDTAEVQTIVKHASTGLIDGVTTNPTLIKKSGRNPEDVYRELAGLGLRDISMEVVADTALEFYKEGKRLAEEFGKVATIKLPCTYEGLQACKQLSDDGIRVNVTLIFSVAQAILAAKAGAAYVSPFVGRVDDNSFDGVSLVAQITGVFREHVMRTQVLAASVRDVSSVSKCFGVGCDIVTMPPTVFEKMYNHVLTDKGLDLFQQDWNSVNKSTKE